MLYIFLFGLLAGFAMIPFVIRDARQRTKKHQEALAASVERAKVVGR